VARGGDCRHLIPFMWDHGLTIIPMSSPPLPRYSPSSWLQTANERGEDPQLGRSLRPRLRGFELQPESWGQPPGGVSITTVMKRYYLCSDSRVQAVGVHLDDIGPAPSGHQRFNTTTPDLLPMHKKMHSFEPDRDLFWVTTLRKNHLTALFVECAHLFKKL
jgi:hypothetical protein